MEIWVNPACSKCRAATSFLDEAGVDYTVRRYLDEPPTAEELSDVLERLGLEPWDIARLGEPAAKESGLADLPRDGEHRGRWIAAMVEHPVLIQRPILTADDGTTVVGRDPESLEGILRAGAPLRP
ncbi:MAG TPA: arsenate reductase family protein [Nocardioidaceae bacterium]|nr:arsenate reductase family protein [Nocardioidaceae bacterium]